MAKLTRLKARIHTDWHQTIDDFLLFKTAQGMAERTMNDYKIHIHRFFDKHGEPSDYATLEKNIIAYFADANNLAPDTINIRRKNLYTFFNWCVQEGIIPANPVRHIKRRKSEGRIRPIEPEVLKQLLKLPDKTMYSGLRDYALIALSLDTGIRPHEALELVASDVNTRRREVYVRAEIAKTRTSRYLPISDEVSASLDRLISINQAEFKTDLVFCTYTGERMAVATWGHRLKAYSKSLRTRISPYDLRHAFAITYLRNGGDAFTLQRIMGHTNMEMTRRYLKFSQSDLHNAHAAASPVASLIGKKRIRRLR